MINQMKKNFLNLMHMNLIMVLSTTVNGKMDNDKVVDLKFGKMGLTTKAIGQTIKLTAKVD